MAIKYGDGTDSSVGRIIRVEKEVSTTTASTSDSTASYSDVSKGTTRSYTDVAA